MSKFEKNRAYKSCCSSEMRPITRHHNSPVIEVINDDNNVFEIDPTRFDVHTSVIVKNIPSSFVFQKEIEQKSSYLAFGSAFLFSIAFETVIPVFLWTCFITFKTIVLDPHAKSDKPVSVFKIGLRDNAFMLNQVCLEVAQTSEEVVVVIDRPSMDLWNLLKSSEVFKKAINNHSRSRVVIVPSMWQLDTLADVFDFANNVWNVYCEDSDADSRADSRAASPSPDSVACSSRVGSSNSLISELSMGEFSPTFVGVVEASK